jgi:hypothetical protein
MPSARDLMAKDRKNQEETSTEENQSAFALALLQAKKYYSLSFDKLITKMKIYQILGEGSSSREE